MRLWEIFRFEFGYQARRPWPWLALAVLVVFAFENTRAGVVPVTLPQDFILNSPFIITTVTVFSCLVWLLVASPMAGEAAARDVQTGMYPLAYTMPVGKTAYLGGRFLAAFALNVMVLSGVQAGNILGVYAGGVSPEIIGPFRPLAYLAAFGFIALPNAFVATTMQFAIALFSGRSMTSYFASVLLVFFTVPVPLILFFALGQPVLARLVDPIGMLAIMNEMMSEWTLAEKNVRMFTLEGVMLWNRVLWVSIASGTLFLTHARFRLAHRGATAVAGRKARRRSAPVPESGDTAGGARPAVAGPQTRQSFGLAMQWRQALAIGGSSFRMVATSPAGLFLLLAFPALLVLITVVESEYWSVPLVPRTGYILTKHLTAPITHFADYRLMVALLIVYFAGELIWRERDAGLHENVDATAVPDWSLLVGKYLGLSGVLAAYMIALLVVGITTQLILGYHDFQPGLYLTILFGLQLPEYLLFAMLVLAIQVLCNHKYVALLVSVVAYVLILFPGFVGIEHNLLIFGASPAWYYTDMRGFGDSVGPWLWFKLYWAAWALLLGVGSRLLWVRGRETGFGNRLHSARRRLTGPAARAAVVAVALIGALGGFVFYNTNVRNEFVGDDELVQRRAKYERLYNRYENRPRPQRAATQLRIDIHPERGTATIRGSYRLVNTHAQPIDSIHLETASDVETQIGFDRAFRRALADDRLGHEIYALADPLQPGDSLMLNFVVQLGERGFSNSGTRSTGAGTGIVANGTHFTSGVLPVIGYQPGRELMSAEDRRKHGLPRQVTLPAPTDIDPALAARPPATFDAIVSTDAGQVAVAPGELRRTWRAAGRSYFHYVSDVPIVGEQFFFSARYAVHRERRGEVDLQVMLHPEHARHMERVVRGVRASLDYYSAEFGAYPYRFLQIVEQPGNFLGMGVDGSGQVTGGEGFFLLDPRGSGFDMMFEVVAHEMGHQWWGVQLKPALAEGGGVLSESLAWYSAMRLVRRAKDREALRRFMSFMRQPNPWPPIRTGRPLLRAMDPWANYRKGPYAMNALSEYVGEERVNLALRRLVQSKASKFATTLDLYRELQTVTPDSLKPLLHDLFEVNTHWTFDTEQARAVPTSSGAWQVTFEIEARKSVVDSAGREHVQPLDEWVEIGVFAQAQPGEQLGHPLYVRKHRIQAARQTITVTVPERPARGGIDPYNLLDWEEGDNIEAIALPDADG